ncbi:MAG: hypothetical protein P1P82_08145 [Bacteroidales bacterium]|nr:hypothetical protein [Bacteroidales bacterium]MDT8430316.1 hypothetical protein [Bacteroidales bacterium]
MYAVTSTKDKLQVWEIVMTNQSIDKKFLMHHLKDVAYILRLSIIPINMKTYIPLLLAATIIMTSCGSNNKIFIHDDPFKQQTTLKLNQELKAYSDEKRNGLLNIADYAVTFKYYYAQQEKGKDTLTLDVGIRTGVRAYETEPALYIKTSDELVRIASVNKVMKMYQQGGSSTSAETSTSSSDDPDDPEKEVSETTTTYTTTSSHDTFQLMQMRFVPEVGLLQKIAATDTPVFRIYIDNEVMEMPLKKRNRRKFKKFILQLSDLT